MGTNYYVEVIEKKKVHLGKSSFGWKFCFELNKGYFSNIKELRKFLKGKVIFNEYGDRISKKEFWERVKADQNDKSNPDVIVIDGYEFCPVEFC